MQSFSGKNFMLIPLIAIHIVLSLRPSESAAGSNMNERASLLLEYDHYHLSCPMAEQIIRDSMSNFIKNDTRVTPQLLRMLFHDCFIRGCDASILLDDNKGGTDHSTEKKAAPNLTIKGFDKIDTIKKALEAVCPGVVSCSDILVLAVRDGVVLSGGPYYPVLTGRKDSFRSYPSESLNDIPAPDDNITRILTLFSARGFTTREIVSLFGSHNIGNIDCQFMQTRLYNFNGTRLPDASIPLDFLAEMQSRCPRSVSMPSIQSGNTFDSHYYESLVRGRGLLHTDQQLMAHPRTAELVRALASDNGITFRREFARAMVKISSLGPLTDTQGEVRKDCSLPN